MSAFQTGEVVETKMAYKKNQTDEKGNKLPLGSIQVRLGGSDGLLNQVRNIYAAPFHFNRRLPLIGEHVIILTAPVTEHSNKQWKRVGFLYWTPYNAVDDITLHQFPKVWDRDKVANGSNPAAPRLSDKEEVGYTFPKSVTKSKFLQPFEGDDLWEGRLGQSIRFSRHCTTVNSPGTGIYDVQATWQGKANLDPLMILKINSNNNGSGYGIEDLSKDDSSIYLTSKQKLLKFKAGFNKNQEVMKIPNWDQGSQALTSADRIVLNAKNDNIFVIGKKKAIITADKIQLQTGKYNVDFDTLMDYINDFFKECWKLSSAQATYTTFAGPTGVATNMGTITSLHKAQFPSKFKKP